ncbi:4Fe-4S single cluster domain-containing protein, partial [Clostridioides difficile]
GGEPFLQPEPLEEIAREAKINGLDVWSYTGFTFEQLLDKKNRAYFKNLNLLKQIDILVDGKFIAEKKDISLKFRGSSNQRIIDVQKSLKYKKVFLVEQYMKDDLSIAE